jgi:hypothetical protein
VTSAGAPPLSARQLNRATLARQLLLRREPLSVVDAAMRITALQAQEPPSPYIALWNRISGFDPVDLDHALATHAIVKATLMRVTMHAVAAADYPAIHEGMQRTLRPARLNDRRFRAEGVSLAEIDTLLPDLFAFTATPRRNQDVEEWLVSRFGAPRPRVWWALRQCGPFVHAATGGPWSFGPRPAYMAAPVMDRPGDEPASQQQLVRRYLEGFGPATVADVATFALWYRPWVRETVDAMRGELRVFTGPGGQELLDVPDGALPDEDRPAPPRLLPMWDSALLAYADRARLTPGDYRRHIARSNGDLLPTLLVDGYVAGVWRPTDDGIEVTAFHPLSDDAWAGIETEARSLFALLESREIRIYARYAHWWQTLPASEVRTLR